ncbi:MAG: ribosomal protein S18-alanine N-acetyltransferase [Candidatus Melainabacteria bacterium]|nr:ribosomal protein S18-alanine N-acetyltransferase [Candidatus Melainabacteria bacterium]
MINHKIRKLNIKDIDELEKIELETYGKYGWSKDIFKSELNNPLSLYLAYEGLNEGSKILGYIGTWLIVDEGHITTLVVCSDFRRKHIADILLYNLIVQLKSNKIKWLTLEVKASNTPAINLYKKFGFKEFGIRKKYYQDNNEDALLLWTENIQTEGYTDKLKGIMSQFLLKENDADKSNYKL